MDEKMIGGLIGAAGTGLAWAGKEFADWLRSRRELLQHVPKQTIRIIQRPGGEANYQWNLFCSYSEVAMEVHGTFNVTNVTKVPITLMASRMKSPYVIGKVGVINLIRSFLQGDATDPKYDQAKDTNLLGQHPIPPGETMQASIDITIAPPFLKYGNTLNTSIAVIDQFGNEHWTRNLDIKYQAGTRLGGDKSLDILYVSLTRPLTWTTIRVWGKKKMKMSGAFEVQNAIPGLNTAVIAAKLRDPLVFGDVRVRDPTTKRSGGFPIKSGTQAEVEFEILVDHQIKKAGEDLVIPVALIDHFNLEHWYEYALFKWSKPGPESMLAPR
ncbi:MAG: hypothetical protein ACJ8FY_21805 [Gemmataceae bacterium]